MRQCTDTPGSPLSRVRLRRAQFPVENIKDIIDVLSTKGKDFGPQMRDPPRCLIPGWDEAEQSVVITGHGRRGRGENLRARLHELANNLSAIAAPEGRP
jgi:hypothetical protein